MEVLRNVILLRNILIGYCINVRFISFIERAIDSFACHSSSTSISKHEIHVPYQTRTVFRSGYDLYFCFQLWISKVEYRLTSISATAPAMFFPGQGLTICSMKVAYSMLELIFRTFLNQWWTTADICDVAQLSDSYDSLYNSICEFLNSP